jgi:hypothetical protein
MWAQSRCESWREDFFGDACDRANVAVASSALFQPKAPVAQQNRAAGFEPEGRGCKSYRERHFKKPT